MVLEKLGQQVLDRLDTFGDFCRFCGQSLSWLLQGTSLRWRNLRLLGPQMYQIGTQSIPVVMITGTFIGMVLAVQTIMQFKAIGREASMGSIVVLSAC